MEINNQLLPDKKKTGSMLDVVEYESNGEKVTLSLGMIKKYLTAGSEVTDQEAVMFLSLCRYQHLNPFLREAYLIKYGNQPATIVTGKDVFLKRAQKDPNYDGFQAGLIVMSADGRIEEREGTFYLPKHEQLVGGWARVYFKNRTVPTYESVELEEYIGKKKDGTANSQWQTRPATMIRKVALVHALREAFPDELGAMYAQEEIPEASGIDLDPTPVAIPDPVQELPPEATIQPQPAFYTADATPPVADPMDALFS